MKTHEVLNQPPHLQSYNYFSNNEVINKYLKENKLETYYQQLNQFGKELSESEVIEWGELANRFTPQLNTHDSQGSRIDFVEFHPAYHKLMNTSLAHGLAAGPWAKPAAGAHVNRAIQLFLMTNIDYGHLCPVSMTYSSVPVIKQSKSLSEIWLPKILNAQYDKTFGPIENKIGATIGMGMTEKQGGSDVRANTSAAEQVKGDHYLLTGHKWFCSAPMSDAFLVLAQAEKGLSCFLFPRFFEGKKNNFFIQRLKNKLGNRSNASSEIEFENAHGFLIGEEGQGVKTIIEMAMHTRLDCVISSAAMLNQSYTIARHHCTYRMAFGKKLVEHSLMRVVLEDLRLEAVASTLSMLRLASSFSDGDSFKRIGTAVLKYWICRRAPTFVFEAMECLGGNGYVEDNGLARIYREAPVNSIWEGSGNIMCLDVLRVIGREPECVASFLKELEGGKGIDPIYDKNFANLKNLITNPEEKTARKLVENMALLLQANLISKYAPNSLPYFLSSRLST